MTEPIQVGVPVAGFYRTRMINSGLWVAVKIWFGQPIIAGEVQDRSPRWCVEVNGITCKWDRTTCCRVPLDPFDAVWPFVAGDPITEGEYRFLLKRKGWAEEHAPDHPAAKPREPINLRKLPPMEP
jgi:hypothetical protein